jgi:hypothetical protein
MAVAAPPHHLRTAGEAALEGAEGRRRLFFVCDLKHFDFPHL